MTKSLWPAWKIVLSMSSKKIIANILIYNVQKKRYSCMISSVWFYYGAVNFLICMLKNQL